MHSKVTTLKGLAKSLPEGSEKGLQVFVPFADTCKREKALPKANRSKEWDAKPPVQFQQDSGVAGYRTDFARKPTF